MSLQNLLRIRSTSVRVHSGSNRNIIKPSYSKLVFGGFKPFSTSSVSAAENKTLIRGINLSWEKFGNGPHVALCFPGFAGSAAINFHPVFKKMNLENFTLVAWDPTGYGKSRPPDREMLTQESFLTDAQLAGALMKDMTIKYSLICYSNGGLSGALLAATEPERIEKLIMCGSPFMSCKFNARRVKLMQPMLELRCWDPKHLRKTLETYEKPYVLKMIRDFLQWVTHQSTNNTFNDFFTGELHKIRAPTLYIRSTKDNFIPAEDALEYGKLIKNFKLHQVAKGDHSHMKYLNEFVDACESFLLSEENQEMKRVTE